MTTELLFTDHPHVAAAVLTRGVQATHTSDTMTVVWSTLAQECCPHQATASWPADSPPEPFDASGCGDWSVDARVVQCGNCGSNMSPVAELHAGELASGELLAAIERVHASAVAGGLFDVEALA